VPRDLVEFLIGKGGKRIKRIQEESDARDKLNQDDDDEGPLILSVLSQEMMTVFKWLLTWSVTEFSPD